MILNTSGYIITARAYGTIENAASHELWYARGRYLQDFKYHIDEIDLIITTIQKAANELLETPFNFGWRGVTRVGLVTPINDRFVVLRLYAPREKLEDTTSEFDKAGG